MQSQRALRFYLERAASAGRRAVARRPHRRASPMRCRRWPSARPTSRRERQDEPYRRAITGIYARLAATAWALDKLEAPHPPVGPAPAYDAAAELQGRSRHHPRLADGQRLGAPGARPPARAAPRGRRVRLPSRRARPAPELRRARARHGRAARGGRRRADYAALDEAARVALLLRELGNPRPLASPHHRLRRGDGRRARDAARRGRCAPPLRPRRRCRTTSSPRPTASPTSSRWRCC